MRKGFTKTLLTVAIATMGFRAAAMAPVVSDMQDLIVGDAENITTTDPNVFVWPDAINLDNSVADDTTADSGIIWSQMGSGRYTFNGVGALAGGEDPNAPPANKSLTQILLSESNPDSNARTVTIRDETLSPIATGGGLGPYPDPGPAGIVNPAGEVVTLIASDGTTYGTQSFIIYSDNNGLDRVAGGAAPVPTIVAQIDFRTGISGWTSKVDFGAMTHTQSTLNGLCMEVPAAGVNFGTWFSAFSFIPTVANAVYRVRLEMITNSALDRTPLWDFIYENGPSPGTTDVSLNAYGGGHSFLDNTGGRNAPSPLGRTNFYVYLTPLAVKTAQIANATLGPYAAANAASKDMRAIFRVLDVEGAGYGGELDAGQVCMRTIDVVRFDFDSMIVQDANLYNITSFTDAGVSGGAAAGPSGYQLDSLANNVGLPGTTLSFTGGVISLTPAQASGWTVEVATVRPGDKTALLTDPAGLADNYPLTWESGQLYLLTAALSAPNAAAEANPADIFRIVTDTPTNEVIHSPYLTVRYGLSQTPKAGTPQEYHAFWHGHTVTSSTVANFNHFRPRVELLCNEIFSVPGQVANNTGGVNIHSVSVKKVRYEDTP